MAECLLAMTAGFCSQQWCYPAVFHQAVGEAA